MKFSKCIIAVIGKHLSSLIIVTAIIIAALIYAYFNPYQSCKRAFYNSTSSEVAAICVGSSSN